MNNKLLLIILVALFSINSYGQRDLDFLYRLPDTKEINSPEFNTIAKFNISVDKLYRNVYIQDIRTSKKNGLHFYQWLYELPLENIKFETEITDENEILITIRSPALGKNFISYWFQDNKISSVRNQNVITLGKWENTVENLESITACTTKLSEYFSTFSTSEKNASDPESGSFEYIASNVKRVNAEVNTNSKIGAYSFDPFFDENNKPQSGELLNSLKKIKLDNNLPTAVIIHSSADGNFENIQLINATKDYPIPFDHLKIKPFNKTNLPTKNLLLLY